MQRREKASDSTGLMREQMEPEYNAHQDEVRQNIDGQTTSGNDRASADPSIFPGLKEILDLPQRILPAETYGHLQNAGREALLAIYSIWRNIDTARNGQASNKVRKHIDVE
jgi:hypothetical protein